MKFAVYHSSPICERARINTALFHFPQFRNVSRFSTMQNSPRTIPAIASNIKLLYVFVERYAFYVCRKVLSIFCRRMFTNVKLLQTTRADRKLLAIAATSCFICYRHCHFENFDICLRTLHSHIDWYYGKWRSYESYDSSISGGNMRFACFISFNKAIAWCTEFTAELIHSLNGTEYVQLIICKLFKSVREDFSR